jgi:hypothetical protein
MTKENRSSTDSNGGTASNEDERTSDHVPEDDTVAASDVVTDPGGGGNESPETQTQEYLRVSALIPTRMVYSNEHERWCPLTEIAYKQNQTPYRRVDAWRVPVAGKTWQVGSGTAPDWVTKHVDTVSESTSTHYVRLPGFLFIATSIDPDKRDEDIPGDSSIIVDFERIYSLDSQGLPGTHLDGRNDGTGCEEFQSLL